LTPTNSFQLSSSMNALQDPTKKPSINSLLNPQESSAHPVGTNHGQNQSNQSASMFQYGPYNLRAANWDPDDDPHKRRPVNGTHNVHRQYQQHPTLPPTSSPHNFVDVHASRLMMRPRIDESPMYTSEGQMWQHKHPQQHSHAVSAMPHPSAMYSDERTGIILSQHHFRPLIANFQPYPVIINVKVGLFFESFFAP
jgi:[histone H3]-dimethyl-L-lysine9 demethylase